MADTKISGLPASTVPLAGTEVLPIVQSSTTKQVSIANVTAGRAVSALSVATTKDTTPSSSLGAFSYGTLNYSDVNHLATFQTSVPNYCQVEIQNTSVDAAASADMVVGNSNTTASTYYGDFGMNSSGWVGTAPFNTPNNVYLTSTTADLAIGTTTANNILFGINGVEYSRISSVGNLLLAQSTDQGTGVLQVTGQSTFNGAVTDKSLNLQGGNNLLTYSGDYSNASWAVSSSGGGVNGIKTPNYGVAPDGTTTACRVQLDVSAGSVGAQSQVYHSSTTVVAGIQYVWSSWIKTTDGTTKTITGFNVYASTPVTLTITGNWQLFTALQTFAGTSTNLQYLLINGTTSSTADLLVWHPQLELGSVASNYTPTTTTAVTTTNNINVPSGQVFGAVAPQTAPTYSFVGLPSTGMTWDGSNLHLILNGVSRFYVNGNGANTNGYSFFLGSSSSIQWNNDTMLYRDAANTLAQRNTTNAQTFRLYNTYTSSTSYETLQFDWTTTANTATISTQKGSGGGTLRTLAIGQPLVISPGYTVATLPTGVVGMRAYVTNALAPSYGVAVTGGGAVTIPVFYNGTAWICA